MKACIRLTNSEIVQVFDPRDPRFEEVVKALKKQGYDLVEADLSEAILDAVVAGHRFDYANGAVVPHAPTPEELAAALAGARTQKIAGIEARDKSDAVNSFTVGGISMWLDRETRAGLSRAIETDKTLGSQTTVIWHEGPPPVQFELPIALAEGMLLQLEAYAKATYNTTQSHIAAVYALDTAAGIEAYDHTAGYPEKLVFNF